MNTKRESACDGRRKMDVPFPAPFRIRNHWKPLVRILSERNGAG
jgi:hypothetical protein